MPILRQLHLAFVHIPKTGGTSIETALGMHRDWRYEDTDVLFGQISTPELVERGYLSAFLQHLTFDEMQQLKPELRSWFSFTFVRNPWDRFVSAFCSPDPHMVQMARSTGVELQGIRFEEFVERTREIHHIHLLPQSGFVLGESGTPELDFVGRFEEITSDFGRLCQVLCIERELPHLKRSDRQASYRSYFDSVTRGEILRRYEQDVEAFEYRF